MSKISADNISNKDDTLEIPTETVIAGSAKAWVNFNGTGTVAIRDSFNVSSITDNGVGDYGINFTNAMSNTDYALVATCRVVGSGGHVVSGQDVTATTTAVRISTQSKFDAAADAAWTNVSIAGN